MLADGVQGKVCKGRCAGDAISGMASTGRCVLDAVRDGGGYL